MGVYVRAYATYVSSMLTHPHSQVNCNRNLQPQNEGGEKRKSRIPIRMSQKWPGSVVAEPGLKSQNHVKK